MFRSADVALPLLCAAAGLGLAGAAAFRLAPGALRPLAESLRLERAAAPFRGRLARRLRSLARSEERASGGLLEGDNLYTLGGAALGLFAAAALTAGSLSPLALAWGTALGSGAGRGLAWLARRRTGHRLRREIAVLYEAVDLYLEGGYTLYDALLLSSLLVPGIRPAVRRCLLNWNAGPARALRDLGEDLGCDESRSLAAVLIQVLEEGYEGLRGVMSAESRKLDELRASLAEAELATKPLYQAVYLILPGLGFLGLILLPWAFRMAQMIGSLHVGAGGEVNVPTVPFLKF
jgi:hypothetical protein